jgi:hypothetical protein
MGWMVALYGLVGLLFAAISVPLIQRRVPPNPWYGFRFPSTLNDPAVWYPANAYGGRLLLGYGLVVAGASLVFGWVFSRDEDDHGAFVFAMTAVLLGGVAVITVLSLRYLRRLT